MEQSLKYQENFVPKYFTNYLTEIRKIFREHKVCKAYAFGSVCTDHFRTDSDIDLIIVFEKRFFDGYVDNFFSLENQLQKLLNRKIDITVEETIQNSYFIKISNQTKTLIYE